MSSGRANRVFPHSVYSSLLKLQAQCSSETQVSILKTAGSRIEEGSKLHSRRRSDLKKALLSAKPQCVFCDISGLQQTLVAVLHHADGSVVFVLLVRLVA